MSDRVAKNVITYVCFPKLTEYVAALHTLRTRAIHDGGMHECLLAKIAMTGAFAPKLARKYHHGHRSDCTKEMLNSTKITH